MTSAHQGPGDWDDGEGEWIDRVLDRAAARIEADELFDGPSQSQDLPDPSAGTAGATNLPADWQVASAELRSGGPAPEGLQIPLSGVISAAAFQQIEQANAAARVAAAVPITPVPTMPPDVPTDVPGADSLSASHSARSILSLGSAENSPKDVAAPVAGSDSEPTPQDATNDLPWLSHQAPGADDADVQMAQELSQRRQRSAAREWGPVLILAVVVAAIFRMFLFTAYHIPSLSMAPTLEVGDRVVVNRLSYQLGDISRGQVVVFNRPPGQVGQADHLIKRVIGLPGDVVTVANGHIWINGQRLNEPYLAQEASSEPRTAVIPGCANEAPSRTECVIPDGAVFVMGDNRRGSVDSRVFGPIEQDSIVGRAFVRIWVLDNVGWL